MAKPRTSMRRKKGRRMIRETEKKVNKQKWIRFSPTIDEAYLLSYNEFVRVNGKKVGYIWYEVRENLKKYGDYRG